MDFVDLSEVITERISTDWNLYADITGSESIKTDTNTLFYYKFNKFDWSYSSYTDHSDNDNDLSFANPSIYHTMYGRYNDGLYFTSDVTPPTMLITDPDGLPSTFTDFTFECNFLPVGNMSADLFKAFFHDNIEREQVIAVTYNKTAVVEQLIVEVKGSTTTLDVIAKTNSYNHVVVTGDGSNIYVYLNGTLLDTITHSYAIILTDLTGQTQSLYLLRTYGGGNFVGYFDNCYFSTSYKTSAQYGFNFVKEEFVTPHFTTDWIKEDDPIPCITVFRSYVTNDHHHLDGAVLVKKYRYKITLRSNLRKECAKMEKRLEQILMDQRLSLTSNSYTLNVELDYIKILGGLSMVEDLNGQMIYRIDTDIEIQTQEYYW